MHISTSDSRSGGQTGVSRTMGKAKKAKRAAWKWKKAPPWGTAAARSDVGTIERWGQKIGVERIDEANRIRRETFAMLAIRDRTVDGGGRVVGEGAVDECEHLALDVLRKAGILDDPAEPRRAKWRCDAGIELLRLCVDGKVMSRSTAAWRAVGGGGGGGVTQDEAEGVSARCEMRYLRALDALGEYEDLIRTVCIDMVVPAGTKRSKLLTGLDLLAEELHDIAPPAGIQRPKIKTRDRRRA